MSQQGGRPTGHEDDWWGQLYDDSAEDHGPAAAGDSLDDRFASAAGTVRPAEPALDGTDADTAADRKRERAREDEGEDASGAAAVPGTRSAPAAERPDQEQQGERAGQADWWARGEAPPPAAAPPRPAAPPTPTAAVPPPRTGPAAGPASG
ncbi:hypothetical protein ACFV9Y_12360, partial [Streptomyces sp. NPDC059894]